MILHYAFDSYIVAQICLYCKAFCNKPSGLFADCFHKSGLLAREREVGDGGGFGKKDANEKQRIARY
jgi:hypothetical protein